MEEVSKLLRILDSRKAKKQLMIILISLYLTLQQIILQMFRLSNSMTLITKVASMSLLLS